MRYLVLTHRTPAFDPTALPAHYDFLAQLRAAGRIELAGAFTDRTGGAYVLRADSLTAATAMAHADPLHLTGSSAVTLHEWNAS